MTPAQMFGVAVRAIGLLVALASAWIFLCGLMIGGNTPGEGGFVVLGITAAVVVVQLLIGISLILWPGWLVAFAYPEPRKQG